MIEYVFLALGSNIGDKQEKFEQAIFELDNHPQIVLVQQSSFMTTKAKVNVPQPDYLNGVIEIKTSLSPEELLEATQEIEEKMGRTSKGHFDPRPIDIDIIFYNDQIISTDDLIIPHALMHERDFVLEPLAEISPDMIHPIFQKSISDLAKTCEQNT